jgi:hypothetical protein
MEAPALASGGQTCEAPDGLAGRQTARLGVTGGVELIVALVIRIAAQTLPGDLLVIER